MTAADPWAKHRSGPIFVATAQLRDMPEDVLQHGYTNIWESMLDPHGKWHATLRIEWTGTEEEFEQYRSERHEA